MDALRRRRLNHLDGASKTTASRHSTTKGRGMSSEGFQEPLLSGIGKEWRQRRHSGSPLQAAACYRGNPRYSSLAPSKIYLQLGNFNTWPAFT
jgi:hypothetical protein